VTPRARLNIARRLVRDTLRQPWCIASDVFIDPKTGRCPVCDPRVPGPCRTEITAPRVGLEREIARAVAQMGGAK
jgi:hypothetical protein